MPEVVTLGPVLLPTQRTGLLLCLLLGIYLCGWFARRAGIDRAGAIALAESTVIVGLIGARLGFALRHWEAFAAEPWTVLYIWQPGYDWLSAAVSASAWLLWRSGRGRASRTQLLTLLRGFALPAVLFGVLLGSLEWSRLHGRDAVAGMLPPAELTDVAGRPVRLEDLAGKPLIINFWATWCPPCRRELPLLNEVQARYEHRGLTVLGINVAEDTETVSEFLQSTPLAFPVWLDPGHDSARIRSLHARLRVRGLPTTYFVDADGMIRSRYVGELSRALVDIRLGEILR